MIHLILFFSFPKEDSVWDPMQDINGVLNPSHIFEEIARKVTQCS